MWKSTLLKGGPRWRRELWKRLGAEARPRPGLHAPERLGKGGEAEAMRMAKSRGRDRYRRNEEMRRWLSTAEVGIEVGSVEACNGSVDMGYGRR